VYVRPQPSSSGQPLGLIAASTRVQIQAKDASGNWYEIVYAGGPGGKAWIASQYVQVKDKDMIQALAGVPDAGPSGVISEQVNVRSGPGAGFDAVGRLSANDVVTLTGRDAATIWLQIQYAGGLGGKGWVAAAFVQASQLDKLPVVAQAAEVLATAAPADIPPTPTLTLTALPDHDSADAPAADLTFSPMGAGSMIYSSDLSAPVGDGEDWIRFTPYGTTVIVTLQCTGNATPAMELTQNGQKTNAASGLGCGNTATLAVAPRFPALLKLFLNPAQGRLEYAHYVLRIDGAP
jgi:uncharacterized protein YraI